MRCQHCDAPSTLVLVDSTAYIYLDRETGSFIEPRMGTFDEKASTGEQPVRVLCEWCHKYSEITREQAHILSAKIRSVFPS